jgi:transposase
VSYAGLDPGGRESAGKSRQLGITKEGSRLLRWVMVETAWRLVNKYQRWKCLFEKLTKNTGSEKQAIVGVARHVLCVMFAMLRDGQSYRLAGRTT